MSRRHMTSAHVRSELDLLLDDITEALDRYAEVRVRVDSAGSLFVDRARTDDD